MHFSLRIKPGPSTAGLLLTRACIAIGLLLAPHFAMAASVTGKAVNADGEPLYKAAVCLAPVGTPGRCAKIRATDKKGGYTFSGLKTGDNYTITINGDRSASNRKFQAFSNYAWSPASQQFSVLARNEKIRADDFVGTFNFSNFQRVVSLTATDFPALTEIDLGGSYVALKVFIPAAIEGEAPQTIFLGQVTDAANLSIDASVPLAVASIAYEIFSATLSIRGSIELAGS